MCCYKPSSGALARVRFCRNPCRQQRCRKPTDNPINFPMSTAPLLFLTGVEGFLGHSRTVFLWPATMTGLSWLSSVCACIARRITRICSHRVSELSDCRSLRLVGVCVRQACILAVGGAVKQLVVSDPSETGSVWC